MGPPPPACLASVNRLRGEHRIGPEGYSFGDRGFQPEADPLDRLQLSYLPVRRGYDPGKIAGAVASVGLLLMVFQLFFRYEYLSGGTAVYRIDRITHQVCRVVDGLTDCAPTKKKSFSVSTSPSLSTSTTVK
jgi:hypothetical protein